MESIRRSGIFIERLEQETAKQFNQGLSVRASDFFGLEADALGSYYEALKLNVSNGVFRFVVLMDRLNDRLKDLISFVNSNSKFDILGVELDFYNHDEFEVIIPRLYGAERKKEVSNPSAPASNLKWDPAAFLDHVQKTLGSEAAKSVKQLYEWSQSVGGSVGWGRKSSLGGFTAAFPKVIPGALFFVRGDGILQIYFPMLAKQSATRAEQLATALKASGFELRPDFKDKYVNLKPAVWASKVAAFIEAVNMLNRLE